MNESQHEQKQNDDSARDSAIEQKSQEIYDTLLSLDAYKDIASVTDSQGNKITLEDFIADVEIDAHIFMEFLKENQTYGTGQCFRSKMREALEKFCYDLAKEKIDNEEQDEPL